MVYDVWRDGASMFVWVSDGYDPAIICPTVFGDDDGPVDYQVVDAPRKHETEEAKKNTREVYPNLI